MSEARELPRRVVVAGDGQVGVLAAIALRRALPGSEVIVIGTPPDPAALADRVPTALPFTNKLHDRVRDFLILHYHATTRDDSEFWNHVRTMDVPDTLSGKMELWRETGRVERYADGLFYDASWIAVYVGQGFLPLRHDARAAIPDPAQVEQAMASLRGAIRDEVAMMPGHRTYLTARAERLAAAP